jgi:hypothetical protein
MTANLNYISEYYNDQAADTDANFDFDVTRCGELSCQVIYSGLDKTDGYFLVSASLDNNTFVLYDDSTCAMSSASGSFIIEIDADKVNFIRFAYVHGSNSAGTYALLIKKEFEQDV